MGLIRKALDGIKRFFVYYAVGGVLTGDMIANEVKSGRIRITEFDPESLNANSYNIRLGDRVTIYRQVKVIDLHDKSTYEKTESFDLDKDGIVLRPGTVYLISTKERIGSDFYEPIITGRSSIGRLGIAIHREAGFGDIGYYGQWTMHLTVTYPTRIYPNDPIAQVYFLTPYGKIKELYHGKYQGSEGAVSSRWQGSKQDR